MRNVALGVVLLSALLPAQDRFQGSVPQGQATAEPLGLSLQDAIARGIKTNLGPLLASEDIDSAHGSYMVARSRVLPNIAARIGETSQQVSLAAFGFPAFPGVPLILGPFGVFDARVAMSQEVFNLQSHRNTKAASENVKAARLGFDDARDTVAMVVTALYLQAVTGASRIETERAQVALANALYQQAVDFKKSGVVPAIDVLRAQVELETQKQRLIRLENEFEKEKLRLVRAIGLPDGQAIGLTDPLPDEKAPEVPLEKALADAMQGRKDYQSMAARLRAAELAERAAAAGNYPSLNFRGDFGAIGKSPITANGTYTAGVSLDIPVFTGGRVRGEVEQASAETRRQRAELEDLRGRIGFEVRSALLDIRSASDQVEVARNAVTLAKQQEAQARDRFAAGVTNNLEVVQAQQALATANDNYLFSLYASYAARASLARAVGGAEQTLPKLLLGAK